MLFCNSCGIVAKEIHKHHRDFHIFKARIPPPPPPLVPKVEASRILGVLKSLTKHEGFLNYHLNANSKGQIKIWDQRLNSKESEFLCLFGRPLENGKDGFVSLLVEAELAKLLKRKDARLFVDCFESMLSNGLSGFPACVAPCVPPAAVTEGGALVSWETESEPMRAG